MATNNFLGSTVKNGTPKETSHLLWQRVQKVSSHELCSGSGLETPHDVEFQGSNSVRSSEESVQVTHHNKNGFVTSLTSSQQNNGHFPRMLLNPEKQVPGHRLSTKFPKSDSRNNGLQKDSNKNVPNEVKVDSVASHGKGDYVLDHGSYLKSRARPTANGRGQDSKGLWTRKATWIEDEQGKCDVEDASGNSKQQKYLRNLSSTRFLHHELFHDNPEPILQMIEPQRPRSAPSTANGSVNGFQEFRRDVASVQKMAQQQVFSSKKPSLPDLFTTTDLSGTPSMDHFIERQASFEEFASQTTGKWKKLGNHPDRNFKEKVGEKEHGSHHVAQKWVPVDHRFGGSPLDSLKLNKARDNGAKHVSNLYDLKDVENVAVCSFDERRSNINCSENGQNISESSGKIPSRSRQALIVDQNHSSGNEFIELKSGVLSLSTAEVNDETKISVERVNFATSDAQPAELQDYPGQISPTDEDFSSVARAILDAVHASLEGRRAAERLTAAVGSPIAEFEKVLEAVAPTIETILEASESKKAQRVCNTGSNRAKAFPEHGPSKLTDTLYKNLVFRCQVDDIPLSAVWDWYEESGNYGVEVKALSLQGSDTCHCAQQFSAFFVPYLSGLQLFECNASCCQSPKRESKVNALLNLDESGDDLLGIGGSNELVNSNIFDTLLPKPLVMDEDYESCCPSESQDADNLTCRSCCSYTEHSFQNNINLLFEFYDGEQPQQRITILQKVQQLIRGEVGVQSQKRGNAALLGSLKLGDLHPASWFSVAWYPIYRIPEGLARDVFLTYHSFGHFVIKKGNCCTSPLGISMPVVGLQYYNCQADQWLTLGANFQKIMVLEKEGLFEVPSEILQVRLKTLKKAAAAMSGHPVDTTKATPFVYKHSDYQFFVNRGG